MNKVKNENKYLILWGFLVILLIGLLTAVGFVYKNKTKVYKELENSLVEAEKKYVEAKFLYPQDNETLKTTSEELLNENYIDNMAIDNQECTGYVKVYKDSTVFKYKAFIKCGRYTTKGYEK